jgi:hypothetical protein
MAMAKRMIRNGLTACSQAPMRMELWYWFPKAIDWATVGLGGGPGLIMKME